MKEMNSLYEITLVSYFNHDIAIRIKEKGFDHARESDELSDLVRFTVTNSYRGVHEVKTSVGGLFYFHIVVSFKFASSGKSRGQRSPFSFTKRLDLISSL